MISVSLQFWCNPFKISVRPAFLPDASFTPEESGQMGLLSGFGKTRFDDLGDSNGHLMHVTLPFVTNGYCQQKYDELPNGLTRRKITSRMLCAGEGGKNACPGDSGFYPRPSKLLPALKHTIVHQAFDPLHLFQPVKGH